MTVKFFVFLGVLAVVLLQYRYWLGDSGHLAVVELTERIETEQRHNDRLDRRNRLLTAEIAALKEGLDAVEARARTALGMIAQGETFFLVVDGDENRTEGEDEPRTP